MAQTFEILLEDFRFPGTLPNSKANFRLIVDVRYVKKDGGYATAHAILPGLDTWWECDRERQDDPNYVRGADQGPFSRVDMSRVDAWDRLVLLVNASSIHSIQAKAFDVNREDVWNRLKESVGHAIEGVLGAAQGLVKQAPAPLPAVSSDALGTAADDLVSHLLKRLANGDRVLFRGSTSGVQGRREIAGRGTGGNYSIAFSVTPLASGARALSAGMASRQPGRQSRRR